MNFEDYEDILKNFKLKEENSLKKYAEICDSLQKNMVHSFNKISDSMKSIQKKRNEISDIILEQSIKKNQNQINLKNKDEIEINNVFNMIFNYLLLDSNTKENYQLNNINNNLKFKFEIISNTFIYLVFDSVYNLLYILDENEKNINNNTLSELLSKFKENLEKNNCYFKRNLLTKINKIK